MKDISAVVIHWDKKLAAEYCEHVFEFCGVTASPISMFGHEVDLLNWAIETCREKYLWFLTPDVELLYKDTAELLVETLNENSQVGVVLPNRQDDRYLMGYTPYRKYLADGTAMLYRMEVGAKFDEDFIFTGWNDLDFGLEVEDRSYEVWVDPRTAVKKSETAYGSWSSFRSAYNARNRILLEAKWCWATGIWQGVQHYNDNCEKNKRIPTEYELAWWSDERLVAFTASVNHEHPQIIDGGCGNEEWETTD